jgi:hypothetical protein
MLDAKAQFFFYLAAVVCFLFAAAGEGWRHGARTRRGLKPQLVLVPFGLALWLFPLMWNTGHTAFA